jgi:hypothetical protein
MAELMTVVLARLTERGVERIADVQFGVQQLVGLEPGYLSFSIWRDSDLPERYALLLHQRKGDGELGLLERLSETQQFVDLVKAYQAPPDVHHMLVEHTHAAQAGSVDPGQMMSMSVRRAEPGYGDDLKQEVSDIFENIRYFEGYLGSVYGPNRAIDEEVIAMVYWKDRRCFDASIPAIPPYEVRLFERIA